MTYEHFIADLKRLIPVGESMRGRGSLGTDEFRDWRLYVEGIVERARTEGFELPGPFKSRNREYTANWQYANAQQVREEFDMHLGDTLRELRFIVEQFEKYGAPRQQTTTTPAAAASSAPPLPVPPHVTIPWLWHNVSLKGWGIYVAYTVAVFLLGFYIAQTSAGRAAVCRIWPSACTASNAQLGATTIKGDQGAGPTSHPSSQPAPSARPLPIASAFSPPTRALPSAESHTSQRGKHNTANPGAISGPVTLAPCAILQNGGSANSAATSCSPPPARTLTPEQKRGISEFLKTLPATVRVSVGSVYGSGDADSYARDYFPLFDGWHFDSQTGPAIRTGFPRAWVGVFVATPTDDDAAAPYRDALVRALNALGIDATGANGTKVVPRGNLEMVIGFNTDEAKTR